MVRSGTGAPRSPACSRVTLMLSSPAGPCFSCHEAAAPAAWSGPRSCMVTTTALMCCLQVIAGMIRHLLDAYNKPVPAILEIPSKVGSRCWALVGWEMGSWEG